VRPQKDTISHPTHHPLSHSPSPVDARTRGDGGSHVDAQGQGQAPQEGAGEEAHGRVYENGIGREAQAEKHEQEGARGFRKATGQHLVLPVLLREDSEQVLEMASHCHGVESLCAPVGVSGGWVHCVRPAREVPCMCGHGEADAP
jgi:hypothetical protein